ncbi:MAG: phenylacetate--CoA ligase family protein [Planctomycetota bacterium]|nr:phenylacetate--CoA ligase family protein [Planctomycetota bacterium]
MDRTERNRTKQLDGDQLVQLQLEKFNALLRAILPSNQFYAEKLAETKTRITSLEELQSLPFTFKDELVDSGSNQDFASNLTYPVEDYVRFHRTSGTQGRPMVVLDTLDDWRWWIETWQYVLDAAEIEAGETVLLAFSFGPFIGFWSAFDALIHRKALVVPSGGLSTLARIDLMRSTHASSLFCTPSYALHMAEVARENQINVAELPIETVFVAGEPGGSVPEIRQQIESIWDAQVFDHSGASEVGPWGFAGQSNTGLHIIESEFIAEFLSVETGKEAAEGELSELVLTTLGRTGSPVIRYRTGDLVRPSWNCDSDCKFVFLDGGVLGRTDDMMVIRGINIFPTSIEQILRSYPEIVEYRLTARKEGAMDKLHIEIEDRLEQSDRIEKAINVRIGLRVNVDCVPLGSLPRFEGKGKRFIDER